MLVTTSRPKPIKQVSLWKFHISAHYKGSIQEDHKKAYKKITKMYQEYQYDALEDQIAEIAAFDTLRNVDPNYNFSKDMGELFPKTGNLKDLKHNFVKSGINNPNEVPPPNEID